MENSVTTSSDVSELYSEIERELMRVLDTRPDEGEERVDLLERPTERPTDDPDDDSDMVLGIDLGTSNSSVAVYMKGKVEVLCDDKGAKTIPSVVSFGNREMFIGQEAKNQMEINPANTFYAVKRLIGRHYSEEQVQHELPYLSYRVDNIDDRIQLTGTRRRLYPEEVSSIVLTRLREIADKKLGVREKWKAVITVPAYFNDAQREATKVAATIAGLDCIRIINEPTAAALAYGITKREKKDMIVLVYDLGGGTLDVSMMRININTNVFQVLASTGNSRLGGEDFDHRLVDYCKEKFKRMYGYENLDDVSATSLQRLRKKCERAKCALSLNDTACIMVSDFYDNKTLAINLSRQKFEDICRDLFTMCMKPVDDVFRRSGISKDMVSEIVLVGGCTRMPKIAENLKTYFDKEPNNSVDPDLVVSMGAALHGYMLTHVDDPYSSSVLLLDIMPLSLGIETTGGAMSVIIPRGTVVPASVTKRYTTDTDNMQRIPITIYEGERKLVKDNRKLGSFELVDLEPAPRGWPRILVTFSVDLNGVLDVKAVDGRDTTIQRTVRIAGNKGRLSQEEIDRLVEEAKQYRLADSLAREIAYYRYEVEDMCQTILENIADQTVNTNFDPDTVREDVVRIRAMLEGLESNDRDGFRELVTKVKQKYSILILRQQKESDQLKAATTSQEGTSVFNDDEDELKEGLADVQDEDIYDEHADKSTRDEVLRLRNELIELYLDLRNALKQRSNLLLSEEDIVELNELIDDTELWVHSTGPVAPSVYENKIAELNNRCNEIMSRYDDQLYRPEELVVSPVQELEALCYALRSALHMQGDKIDRVGRTAINTAIDEVLDWIYDNREQASSQDCQERMTMLNKLSELVYQRSNTIVPEDTQASGMVEVTDL